MIEVKVTKEMLKKAGEKAKEMGTINNSIVRGDGNIAGFLGEEVANNILSGQIINTFDYDILTGDLCGNSQQISWDVKTKRCKSPPRDYYECSVADIQNQKCDRYVFVRVQTPIVDQGKAWVLGWLPREEYFKKARKMTKGETDPSNGFVVKADCHNVAIKDLNKFESRKCKTK